MGKIITYKNQGGGVLPLFDPLYLATGYFFSNF